MRDAVVREFEDYNFDYRRDVVDLFDLLFIRLLTGLELPEREQYAEGD